MERFVEYFHVILWRYLGPNHCYIFDGAWLRRLAAMTVSGKKSSEVKYKGPSDQGRVALKIKEKKNK